MRRSAIALVCSGVRRCLVSGTSLPLMRARKTSPALMCRSEAPRSTAALMIFSMLSVPGFQVHDVHEGRPCKIAPDVVHDEGRLTLPEASCDGAHVRTHQHPWMAPEGVALGERLDGKNVQSCSRQPSLVDQLEKRDFIEHGAARDVDHDGMTRQPLEHRA